LALEAGALVLDGTLGLVCAHDKAAAQPKVAKAMTALTLKKLNPIP
jgi:hypothetical protein